MKTATETTFVVKDETDGELYVVQAVDSLHAIAQVQENKPKTFVYDMTRIYDLKTYNIEEILEYLQDEHYAEWCDEYGEPGYHSPETGIIFANWNDIDKDIQDALEEAGYELEWQDEWVIDYSRSKAWRTAPTHHGWQSSIMITDDGELITPDDGVEAFIEECAMTDYGQPIKALPGWVSAEDLEEAGFRKVNEDSYENGWFPGQTDKPEDIAQDLFKNHNALEVVFQIDENSQFYTRFSAWMKEDV